MLNWESIEDSQSSAGTYRAKVIGGWLVKTVENVHISLHDDRINQSGYEWRTAMCFVPD